jgi:two-component system sensor histidine kinase/response regulator
MTHPEGNRPILEDYLPEQVPSPISRPSRPPRWRRPLDIVRNVFTAPEHSQDAAVDFAAYSRTRTVVFGQLITLVTMLSLLVLLPTDFWVFAGKPRTALALAGFRVVFVALLFIHYALVQQRLNSGKIPLRRAIVGYFGFIAVGYGSMGMLSGLETPLVYTALLIPMIPMLFLLPLRQRIVVTALTPVVIAAAYYGPHPAYWSYVYNPMIAVDMAFSIVLSMVVGHMIYKLEERSYRQRREIQQHAGRLEELNRLKDGFVATISHELRTPLNAILGLTDVVLEEKLQPEVRQYVRTIHHSGEVLLALINDTLDLAKIKSGKLELELTPVALPEIVETTLSLFAVACHEKGLDLTYSLPVSMPRLRADPRRLQQILLNLLGNAVKFTAAGEVRLVVTWQDRPARELLIAVSDTGEGIPVEKRQSIFEEFTQVDVSTTRRFGGTGLGLSIVSRLVRLMGGEVAVTDNGTRGSTFTVKLPLEPVDAAPTPPALPPALLAGRPRFIVCVSHPLRRQMLAELFWQLRVEVELTQDLDELASCWQRLREQGLPVRGVLISLPALSPATLQASSVLSSVKASAAPLVIVQGPRQLARHAAAYQRLGVSELLVDPLRQLELRDALFRVLGGPASASASSAPLSGPDAERLRVLVVDDVRENLLVIEAFVKGLPVALTLAANGVEGLEKFMQSAFDVVLLDIEMPEMDGYTAVRHMRAFEQDTRRSATPVVAMTAHSPVDHQERLRDAGFSRVLAKPMRRRTFLKLLDELHPGLIVASAPTVSDPAVLPVEIEALRPAYLSKLRTDVAQLGKWLEQRQFESIRQTGHNWLGTGGLYGLVKVTAIGQEIERAARREDGPAITALGDELISVLDQTSVPPA